MKQAYDISILVLVYNAEPYIAECINSIKNQTIDASLQLIVMNDDSTDDTLDAINQAIKNCPSTFQDIQIHTNSSNLGSYKNLQAGLKHCTGKYIAYMEGDDYWTDGHKLAKQWEYLKSNPKISGTTTGCIFVDESGKTLQSRWYTEKKSKIYRFKHLWSYPPFQTSTLLFERDNLTVLPDSDLRFSCNDKVLFVLLSLQGGIYYDSAQTTAYRFHDSNFTNTSTNFNNQLKRPLQANNLLFKTIGIKSLIPYLKSLVVFLKTRLVTIIEG